MHEVLVNRLGGLRLPRKSVVRLTDRPDMTLDVKCGRKTTQQQQSVAPDFQCCYFCKPSCLFCLRFNFDFYVSKIMHLRARNL